MPSFTTCIRLTLLNDGFEDPIVDPGRVQFFDVGDDIGGWTAIGNSGNSVALIETTYSESFNGVNSFVSQEGNNSLDLTGPFNQGLSNGVQQQIGTT